VEGSELHVQHRVYSKLSKRFLQMQGKKVKQIKSKGVLQNILYTKLQTTNVIRGLMFKSFTNTVQYGIYGPIE
jgi:hypothetical protein